MKTQDYKDAADKLNVISAIIRYVRTGLYNNPAGIRPTLEQRLNNVASLIELKKK